MAIRPRTIQAPLAKIVVIDDESDLLDLVAYNLTRAGYAAYKASNGEAGLHLIRTIKPDLVVLDIMMPGMDGVEVCKAIRRDEQTARLPVLMLTAKQGEDSEVLGLDAGADDYITKPVSPRLLLSRMQALLRRVQNEGETPDVLHFGALEINREQYIVRLHDKVLKLPKKEFQLLYMLAAHPKQVFTRDDLLEEIWGADVYVVVRTVDVHIRKIRRKIGEDWIETVKGVGYKFRG